MTAAKNFVRNRYLGNLDLIGTYGPSYSYGIYSDVLPAFAKLLKNNIKSHRQNVIVIDGHTGSGKSTAGVELCRLMDPNWRLQGNYIYSTADLKAKLRNPNSSPISLFDEGSISLNSYNSLRKDDKALVALFDTMRSRGWTSVICMPSFDDLNKRIRTNHVDYRIVCPAKAPLPGYDARGFIKLYKHVYRDWGKPYFQLMATGTFNKMPQDIAEEYEKLKRRSQERLINQFLDDEEEEL